MPNRREGAATTVVGGGLVATGGHLRHVGVTQAVNESGKGYPKVHPKVFLRVKTGRGKWAVGSALGAVGATGMAAGVQAMVKPSKKPVIKLDSRKKTTEFIGTGLRGNAEAIKQRAENVRQPVPAKARAAALGVSGALGGLGSLVARRAAHGSLRAPLSALGGATVAAASLPVTSRVTQHLSPGYEVTASGVRRKKKIPVRPSQRASIIDARGPDKRRSRAAIVPSSVGKLDSYPGKQLTSGQKRAAIYAAGSFPVPLANDVAAATTASRLGPPEQRHKTFATQLGSTWTGSAAGAAGGGYLAHRLTRDHPGRQAKLAHASDQVKVARAKTVQTARRAINHPLREGPKPLGRVARAATKMGIPKAGAAVATGAVVGQMVGGQIGGWTGTSANLRRERTRNTVHKAVGTLMSPEAQRKQLHRKRRSARLSATSGGLGLTSLVMLPKHPQRAFKVGVASGAIGGVNGLEGARISMRDIRAQEHALKPKPVNKALSLRPVTPAGLLRARTYRRSTIAMRRSGYGTVRPVRVSAGVA